MTLLITLVFGGMSDKSFAERYKVMLIRKQIYGCTVIEETTCGGGKGGGEGGGNGHMPTAYPESNDVVTNCDSTNRLSPKHVTNMSCYHLFFITTF